jgi:hypothetical protein
MSDSLYHPVMPWVTDFTTAGPSEEKGGFRDLSMSKFRYFFSTIILKILCYRLKKLNKFLN